MAKVSKRLIAEAILSLVDTTPQLQLAEAIAAYVVSERRTNELDAILREVQELRRKRTGVKEVTLTSAFELSDATVEAVKALLKAKAVVINKVIDHDVIGGVRMETSGKVLDLTVRNRLNRFKRVKIQGV